MQSALIDQPKTPNRQDVGKDDGIDVGYADKILELISGDPSITIPAMAEKIDVTTRTVERGNGYCSGTRSRTRNVVFQGLSAPSTRVLKQR